VSKEEHIKLLKLQIDYLKKTSDNSLFFGKGLAYRDANEEDSDRTEFSAQKQAYSTC